LRLNPQALTKNVYLFSGLGADKRIFQRLSLPGYSLTYMEWKVPLDGESIEHYAGRLISQITTASPILIGLSFGGIMAIEIAKIIETEKVILISSVESGDEIPFYYRWMGHAGIHKHIPADFFKNDNFLTNWLFGTVSTFDQQVLRQILNDTNPAFFTWALDQVVHWKNHTLPDNLVHIHGSSDRILPIRFTRYDIVVRKGGHFMTLNKSDEINKILKVQLAEEGSRDE
jgi:hypothetical protein